ncbi:MAG: M20/M25/M40 family metallo-hydrolase, partial [Candidatus Jordarchaeales archaeon]
MINAIEFLKELLEIPSPSGSEGEVALFLSKRLDKWGYHVEVDRAGNVVAQLGEGEPVLLLASHLDTVPGHFPVREEGGKIFGRGAVDAKASVAAMAIAGVEAARSEIRGKIVFAGIVEEETSLRGIQTLLEELPSINYAIFGEPTGKSRVCLASKGRLLLKIDVRATDSGHVACSWRYKNAIEEAFNLWTLLKKELSKMGGSYFSSTIPNLTIFQGGNAPNITPEQCSFYVDVRFPPGMNSAQLLKVSDDVIEAFRKSSGLKVDYNILSQIEGFRTSK